ncbi:hypothetical protein BDW68DRAFT_167566 [Aspergillus falconensis]
MRNLTLITACASIWSWRPNHWARPFWSPGKSFSCPTMAPFSYEIAVTWASTKARVGPRQRRRSYSSKGHSEFQPHISDRDASTAPGFELSS